MVYKKYIKRNGKLYGPYNYHSRRVNGKVVSEYRGSEDETNYKKFVWPVLGVLFLALIVYAMFNVSTVNISGNAVMDLGATYQEGEILKGQLDLFLNEGELIPLDTKVIFQTNTQTYEYALQDVILDSATEGDFYVSEKSINGTGLGFGQAGIIEEYPIVYFELSIYSNSEEGNIAEAVNESENVEVVQDVNESADLEIAPGLPEFIANFFLALTPTGNVALNLDNTVEGQVSYGNNFVFDLIEGQTAELVAGSVHTDVGQLSDNDIEISVAGGKVAVITSYSQEGEGFGEKYLGDKTKKLSINLDELGMIFDKGTLDVKLVYGAEEIVTVSTILGEGNVIVQQEVISNQDSEVGDTSVAVSDTTLTQNSASNIPVIPEPIIKGLPSNLEDFERETLENKFGETSIQVTKAKENNNKITVRYELENYWFEATYDVSLSKEVLTEQMNMDKTKWLRDVLNTFSKAEIVEQDREDLVGNYSI